MRMEKPLIAFSTVMLVAAVAVGQRVSDKDRVRDLENEIRMLRTQIAALRRKLSPPGEATTGPTTRKTRKTRKVASKGLRVTRTFSIHEFNPAWWRDSALFVFELTLRETIAGRFPREAPQELLARNRFFEGQKVDWKLNIDSAKAVTEGQAGRDYYSRVDELEQQKQRIEDMRKQSRSGDREQRLARRKAQAEAEVKLKEIEALARQQQKLMMYKGASLLTASYKAKSSRTSKGAAGVSLEVTVALTEQDAKRLEKYRQAKSKKYSSRGGRWPIRVVGTLAALRYDGRVLRAIVDGTWRDAPGGGDGDSRSRRKRPRSRKPPDRRSRRKKTSH